MAPTWDVDAAHRYVPTTWSALYVDPQAHMSNGVHAVMDSVLGPAVVHGLREPEHCLAYFVVCLVALAAVLLVLRPLLHAVWPAFARVAPAHKQMYALVNLVKSLTLALQCASASWLWYSKQEYMCLLNPLGFEYTCSWNIDIGHAAYVKQIGLLYVATDVVALLLVAKLPFTTKVHHYAGAVYIAWMALIDLGESPVFQRLCFYGFWSTLACPVNGFLGLRVVCPSAGWMAPLAKLCFVWYLFCCSANWGLHLLWGVDSLRAGTLRWQEAAYLASLSIMIRDDLILMNWLRRFKPQPAGEGRRPNQKKSL